MEKIILIGRIGGEPMLTTTKSGSQMLTFNLAANHTRGDEHTTTWYRIKTMNFSNNFVKTLKKGSYIFVIGDLQFSMFIDKNGVERPDHTVWATSMEYVPGIGNTDMPTDTVRSTQVSAQSSSIENPTINTTPPANNEPTQETSETKEGDSDLPF